MKCILSILLLAASVCSARLPPQMLWSLIPSGGSINEDFVTTWTVPADALISVPYVGTGFNGTVQVEELDGTVLSTDTFSDADMSALTDIDVSGAGAEDTELRMRISGTFPRFAFYNGGDRLYLKTVENMGYVGWGSTLANAFQGCNNMTHCNFGDSDLADSVTSLSWAFRDCTSLLESPDVNDLIKVNDVNGAWRNCSSMTNASEVSNLTLLTNLQDTWNACKAMTVAPDVSGLTSLTSIQNAWKDCWSLTNASEVNTLTNLASLQGAWQSCRNLVTAPAINNLTGINNLGNAWSDCRSLAVAPDVSTLTEIVGCWRTWSSCYSITEPPDLSNNTKITGLWYAFNNCISMESAPDLSGMTDLSSLKAALGGCSVMTNAPDLSGFTKITDLSYLYDRCYALDVVNIPDDISSLTTAAEMLNSTAMPTGTIDDILNTAASSLQANGGEPSGITIDLGAGQYTTAAVASYNYLTNSNWTIVSGGLE